MNQLPVMAVLERKTYLRKPVNDLILSKVLRALARAFHFLTQITTISIIHHQAQLFSLGDVDLNKRDDIRMLELFQDFGLFEGHLALFERHSREVHFLDHAELFVFRAFDEVGLAEGTLAELLNPLVRVDLPRI